MTTLQLMLNRTRRQTWLTLVALIAIAALVAAACGDDDADETATADQTSGTPTESRAEDAAAVTGLSGTIEIAGSSTVFPISEAWAEEFGIANPGARVNVASIGSGAGFERFCNDETDISNASRPMKGSEFETCSANGVEFIEIPVAFDGLSVVVNNDNDWVDSLTVAELAHIFGPDNFARTWADVRPGWPDEPIRIFSPGADSGTFDYFSETINDESGLQRTADTLFSEDDNVLVQGVAGERGGIGYFGFAYFVNNTDLVRAVPIDPGAGPVAPTTASIENGTYQPLSRPIFIYAKTRSLERPAVRAFVQFALGDGRTLIDDPTVGYVQLPDRVYAASLDRVAAGAASGALVQAAPAGATLAEIFVN